MLFISILEGIYIVYMFNYFKTKYGFNHPFEYLLIKDKKLLKHPINTGIYENKICKLGNHYSYLLFFWLIIRNFFTNNFQFYKKKINNLIINSTLIISLLMNFNAFVYFFPIYILEKKYLV